MDDWSTSVVEPLSSRAYWEVLRSWGPILKYWLMVFHGSWSGPLELAMSLWEWVVTKKQAWHSLPLASLLGHVPLAYMPGSLPASLPSCDTGRQAQTPCCLIFPATRIVSPTEAGIGTDTDWHTGLTEVDTQDYRQIHTGGLMKVESYPKGPDSKPKFVQNTHKSDIILGVDM